MFRRETLDDGKFLMCSALSLVFIVAGTELRFFNRILETVDLDFNQWVTCLLLGSAILFVSEVHKAILHAREAPTEEQAADTIDLVAAAA